jgi:putative PIN family toxin of toxin-antitoxin system
VIRIVLDTNVLVSGLLSDRAAPGQIVDLVTAGEIELACDARILAEYREVLARPELRINQTKAEDVLQYVEHRAVRVTPDSWPEALPDPDDEPFLAVAKASQALCLVTGNLKHFPAKARLDVRVVTPRQFVDAWQG